MIYLMTDKLGYDFQYCELPSQVVTFLENNMKRSKVISVLKHALAVMRFHGRFGTLSFADWIARYQASHVHLEDDNFVGRLGDIERICETMKDETYLGNPLSLNPPNKLSSFKFLCQTARRLIRIQAVRIWHFGCAWRAKG